MNDHKCYLGRCTPLTDTPLSRAYWCSEATAASLVETFAPDSSIPHIGKLAGPAKIGICCEDCTEEFIASSRSEAASHLRWPREHLCRGCRQERNVQRMRELVGRRPENAAKPARQEKLSKREKRLAKRAAKKARTRAATAERLSKPITILPGESTFSREAADQFYRTWAWRTLRMEVLKQYGRTCQCCGAKPGDSAISGAPVRIVVDHIKPLSKFWQLRLTKSNLQVLCDECNQGKGNWDQTDYRCESIEWTEGDPLTEQYRQIMGGVH